MSTFKLPSIQEIPKISNNDFLTIIDSLFEPNDTLHSIITGGEAEAVLKVTEYSSYDELIDAVKKHIEDVTAGGDKRLDEVLAAHPRLGAKKVESAQSQAEQAQLNTGGEEEAKKLAAFNEEYEKQFPGLRYVVFVNGRSREEIMKNMRVRIDRGDIELERKEALQVYILFVFSNAPLRMLVSNTYLVRLCQTSQRIALANCSKHKASSPADIGSARWQPAQRAHISSSS